MNYDKLMAEARALNTKRDQIDRSGGFSAPSDGSMHMLLITAMLAIEAGIKLADWSVVAEGQAMLEDLENRLRPLKK